MATDVIKLAIIGVGSIVESAHLKAVAAIPELQVALLIDKDLRRATELAARFGVPRASDSLAAAYEGIDACLVAVPNSLHASIVSDLLHHRVPTLVEKPMACDAHDCEGMLTDAREAGTLLGVAHMRRFSLVAGWTKALLDAKVLGRLQSFDLREGARAAYRTASGFTFRKEQAGGGVLMDIGPHALDLTAWWLGKLEHVEYRDDDYGGMEADARVVLRTREGAEAVVELSRTRNLRNTARIRGEKGAIEVHLHRGEILEASGAAADFTWGGVRPGCVPEDTMLNWFERQLGDWARAVRTRTEPAVTGADGAYAVSLIEVCYRNRKPLELPWL